MRLEEFWSIVDAARTAAGEDVEDRVPELLDRLSKLPVEAIEKWQRHYQQQLVKAYRWDLWGAAFVMNGGCSDDGFRYFRDWLISEGQTIFTNAVADPESLAELPKLDWFDLETYGYVAPDLIESKNGAEADRNASFDPPVPVGTEWTEDQLPTLFPKLAAKYYA
jgi:hypothetical protein